MIIPIWLQIILGIATIGGVYWAWREDYISWDIIKESLGMEQIKDMLLTVVTQPLFILLYVIFVLAPVWWFGEYIAPDLPLYYKILISIGGVWAVNLIMDKKDLK